MSFLRTLLPCAALAFAGCTPADNPVVLGEELPADALVDAGFPVGVAVPADPWPNSLLGSPERRAIVSTYFSSITAENAMKMAYLHPAPDRFAFDDADVLVGWARQQGLVVHGHALVWHNQSPEWMNVLEGDRENVEAILANHVTGVAGHFAGRLASWDVVNEAFTDDDPSDYRDTVWYRRIGPDYIEQAFRTARAADPDADLYYNDYDISGKHGSHKLDRVLAMADDFLERGVPIDGIGFQMHIDADHPPADAIRQAFAKVVARGLKVRISELDISVNRDEGLSRLTIEVADLQRLRYAEIARAYREVVPPAQRGGITVWGITDGDSWIPGFRDRRDWPLLFNADFSPKPALAGLAEGLGTAGPVAVFDSFEYRGRDEIFEALPDGHFQNPVAAGFFPDPSIARVGDDYYMANSSFAYLPGVPISHSRNIVDWTLIGHALTRPEQADFAGLGVSRGIFAPTLRHHDGTYYLATTAVDAGGNFYVTAGDPAGPWSDPVWLPEVDGIDPDLFFDEDGRAWLAHNGPPPGAPRYDGHRAIWLWELDLEAGAVVPGSRRLLVDGGSDPAREPIWVEGPHLFRHNGWYYLICAEGGTGGNHSEVVFRARRLTDPFVAWDDNPILTQRDLPADRTNPVTSAGHADFVQTPQGDWWSVFLGTRAWDVDYYATGRETFALPVYWENGWPVVLPPGAPVPYQPRRPAGLPEAAGSGTLTGNVTWRDEFDAQQLDAHWSLLRRVVAPWLKSGDGRLEMVAQPYSMASQQQPAYIGRRLQHQHFEASTRLGASLAPGVAAGLVAFQNETHHIFIGLQRTATGSTVFIERAAGGAPERIAERHTDAPARSLELWLRGDTESLTAGFRTPDGKDVIVQDGMDPRVLTTAAAGGFVGTTLGLHARREGDRDR